MPPYFCIRKMKMQKMKLKLTLYAIAFLALLTNIQTFAQTQTDVDAVTGATSVSTGNPEKDDDPGTSGPSGKKKGFLNRLSVGGYGEAVYTYNMYSDNFGIYSSPETYRNVKGHGRFDLPHVVVMLGYDFGRGWTLGMEIEFEHGGVEAMISGADGPSAWR